jgi:hypothetical protein
MGWTSDSLRVPLVLLIVTLPLLSAVSVSKRGGKRWGIVYLRCLAAYFASFSLIAVGYFFQNIFMLMPQASRYWGGWQTIWVAVKFWPHGVYWGTVVTEACIVQFVVLLSKDREKIAVAGFRASFLTLAFGDILYGIINSFGPEEYVRDVFFNFIGAIAFAVVNAAIVNRVLDFKSDRSYIFPASPATTSDG